MSLSTIPDHMLTGQNRRFNLNLWLAGSVFVFWLGIIWLWEPGYLALTFDDSFYYLKTAMNLAHGFGATFDQVTMTNGFHPLWMLMLIPLGWLTQDNIVLMTRCALMIQIGLIALGMLILHRHEVIDLRKTGGILAFLLVNYYTTRMLINGLESALQFALLAGLVVWWHQLNKQSQLDKASILCGLWCGALTLARLEMGLLALTAIFLLPLQFNNDAYINWKQLFKLWAIGLFAFGLIITPYIVWNYSRFGHLMPVSAAIKMERYGLTSLQSGLGALGMVIGIGGGSIWLLRRNPGSYRSWKHLMPLFIYCLLLAGYYLYVFGPHVFALWYFVPYLMLAITGLGRLEFTGWWIPVELILAGAALLSWGLLGFSADRIAPYLALCETGTWLREHTSADTLIAGWDVGIISAHSERRVINLDGLINSWGYKETYLDQGQEETYIKDHEPVEYIAQRVFVGINTRDGQVEGVDLSDWSVAHVIYLRTPSSILRTPNDTLLLAYLVLSREPIDGQPLFKEYEFYPAEETR